jgi:hypothetical protein
VEWSTAIDIGTIDADSLLLEVVLAEKEVLP